jgi:hypothetical protein
MKTTPTTKILAHAVEKLLLFARRVTLGSAKIRFIVIRCRPIVDRRRWRVSKNPKRGLRRSCPDWNEQQRAADVRGVP